jgi:hypothetical protein
METSLAIFFIIACEFTIIHVGLPGETLKAVFWHYDDTLRCGIGI